MAEMSAVPLPYPEADAKNLFVRDDKRQRFYLITVQGEKRVDLKKFRRKNNTRPLSFASEEELKGLLGLRPGAVTPLGLLNDAECKVEFFIDRVFLEPPGIIGVHPNDNTATVFLKTEDLMDLVRAHGNAAVSYTHLHKIYPVWIDKRSDGQRNGLVKRIAGQIV